MTDLDMLLNKAKLAEQAERYKDMKEVYIKCGTCIQL